jgi:excinuclease ABC subunit B
MSKVFKLKNLFKPAGDQPQAILELSHGLARGLKKQTLLGATGTGKTFTIANVIEKLGKPTLVLAHNKTLAAQLAQEFKEFFPEAAVHYFVSYYDYYQPEAYLPVTDTYIEKDASINKEIDRLRHASTQALLTRKDVIIVASVSAIYGLGSPEEYEKVNLKLEVGTKMDRATLMKNLIRIHFERTNADLTSGTFRSVGDRVEFIPISEIIKIKKNNLVFCLLM